MTDAPYWEDDWDNAEEQAASAFTRETLLTVIPLAVVTVLAVVTTAAECALVLFSAVAYPDWRWRALCIVVALLETTLVAYRRGKSSGKGPPRQLSYRPVIVVRILVRSVVLAAAAGVTLALWWPVPVAFAVAAGMVVTGIPTLILRKRMTRMTTLRDFLEDFKGRGAA